jgi:DUF1365 family protein
MITHSALYVGQVMHQRLRPRRHRLSYRLYMLLLDLDEVDACAARLRLFSRGSWNLFSFHDADHGAGTAEPLRAQVERHLHGAGLAGAGGAIRLLTMPRVLGFAFNPISVYFCYRADGELAATLYEVNNTFGQRHSYLLPVAVGTGPAIRQTVCKRFHVSPFMGMDMDYAFRVVPPAAAPALGLGIIGSDAAGAVITAVLTARRRELTDAALLRAFFAVPLVTLKVVAGIGWEALKLWLKGVRWRPRPAPPSEAITMGNVMERPAHVS